MDTESSTNLRLTLLSDWVNCIWASVCSEEELLFDTLTFLIYIPLPPNLCRVCWLYYQSGAEMLHPGCKYATWTSFHHIFFLSHLFLSFLSHYMYIHTWSFSGIHTDTLDTRTHTHARLTALKPESVSVKSLSYFSGWWNILLRPENIINRGPHCLLPALACIRNVIILQPATSSSAFMVGSDHNILPSAFKEERNNKDPQKKHLNDRFQEKWF